MKLFALGMLSTMNGALMAMAFIGPPSSPPFGVGCAFLTVLISVVALIPDDMISKK
jgi:hypothetical protein